MKKISANAKKWHLIRSLNQEKRISRKKTIRCNLENVRQRQFDNEHKIRNYIRTLSYIYKPRKSLSISSKRRTIKFPSTFSIIENPEETLYTIAEFVHCVRSRNFPVLHADHSRVENSDLAAEALLSLCTKVLWKSPRHRKLLKELSGLMPESDRARRMLVSMGVPGVLEQEKLGTTQIDRNSDDERKEQALEVFRGESVEENSPRVSIGSQDKKTRVCKQFCEHINKCLDHENKSLTPSGLADLQEYVGEILNNAEDHTADKIWYVQGYMDVNEAEHFCDIAIFNFGPSISETISKSIDASDYFGSGKEYVEKHQHEGFGAEALRTVWALQERVSRFNDPSDGSETRGCGTADLLEFFSGVSEECAPNSKKNVRMSITSGSCHILMDGAYQIAEDASCRKVIWFNAHNSPSHPPDKRYVRTMRNISFPGTMIAIRFPINAVSD